MKKIFCLLVFVFSCLLFTGCDELPSEFVFAEPLKGKPTELAIQYILDCYNFKYGTDFKLYDVSIYTRESERVVGYCDIYEKKKRIRCKVQFMVTEDGYYYLKLKETE